MNKSKALFTVLLALVSVLILFSIAKTEDPTTYAIAADGGSQAEQTNEAPVQPIEEPIMQTAIVAEPEVIFPDEPRAAFVNEGYDRYSRTIKYTAFAMLGDEPIPGLEVTEYCNGEEVSTTMTADNGWFRVIYDCRPGYKAWVEAKYDGQRLMSDQVYIPQPIVKRSSGSSEAVLATGGSSAAGVPEFSATTLALVVVTGTLGVALLRKQ